MSDPDERTPAPPKVTSPDLTPEEKKGLQDYWRIYEAHRPEITDQLLQMAREHEEFKLILQNAPPRSAEQENQGIELQRRAIYNGDWEP